MHQYASECIKMYHNVCRMNYFNVLCIKFQFEKFQFFWLKMTNFFSKCSEWNVQMFCAFKGAKISKILVTLCDGRPCTLFVQCDFRWIKWNDNLCISIEIVSDFWLDIIYLRHLSESNFKWSFFYKVLLGPNSVLLETWIISHECDMHLIWIPQIVAYYL